MLSLRSLLFASLLACGSLVVCQDTGGEGPPGGGFPGGRQTRPTQQGPRPYADVVTKEAVTEKGVFLVHRIGDRVLFEIPENMLGREYLVSTEIAELPAGMGYGGQSGNERVVRFTRRNNKVFMRNVDYSIRATESGGLSEAVRASTLEPILATWDVEAEGEGKSAVIDVSRYFVSDPTEFSLRGQLGGGSPDAARSYIDRASAYPENVVVRSLVTFSGGGGGAAAGFGGGRGGGQRPNNPANTALIHFTIVLLPKEPMMGRLADSRVGYFSRGFQVFGHPDHKVIEQAYITRHRLEKKNPTAALSEPVKPIIYYLSREVPDKWRPYIKKGIEDWQVAFEKAGFKNAILAKDAPTKEEDPRWDPEDVRYSVIRWAPTTTENAMGPNVHDPRSGEIISAHIIVWHNILKLLESWYFVQASPLDKRAQKLPFPDELMGELVRYVVAHEVGHTLGLQHNFIASNAYTVDQLRDAKFTNENGTEASIMDYGRFNYVAQPSDGARLIPIVGPYDKFAIEWGYKPIPGAKTPEDEKKELDKQAALQLTHPEFRFGSQGSSDPYSQSEDLGSDAVAAGRLGMANISRIMKFIVPATTKLGEDYDVLREMYGRLWGQRTQELRHAAALIGGWAETNTHAGRGGSNFDAVPRAKQKAALMFLDEFSFMTPKEMIAPDVLRYIEPNAGLERVSSSQRSLLSSLLQESRIRRMLEAEALYGASNTYTARELVFDLQNFLFKELSSSASPDLYRRNLHRIWLEVINDRLNPQPSPPPATGAPFNPGAGQGDSGTQSELRPILFAALDSLNDMVTNVMPKAKDSVQRAHLTDLMRRIQEIMESRKRS